MPAENGRDTRMAQAGAPDTPPQQNRCANARSNFSPSTLDQMARSSYLTYQSFKQEILGISPTIDDHHHIHSIVGDPINDSPRGDQQLPIEVQAYVGEFGNDSSSLRESFKRLRSFV